MNYVFEAGKPNRVMHIERTTMTGEQTFTALCGQRHAFDRTINAPWGLGRRICKKCRRALALSQVVAP